jgi:hypothetical protein
MTTLEKFRNEQQAQYKINHEIQMAKYPWIREAINASKEMEASK